VDANAVLQNRTSKHSIKKIHQRGYLQCAKYKKCSLSVTVVSRYVLELALADLIQITYSVNNFLKAVEKFLQKG